MKLYLHCGYHKTGSSFLQTMFARNRNNLEASGIYFPIADREFDMQTGNISPGNGPELAKSVQEKDEAKALDLLKDYMQQAEKKNCDRVLLSSENFFHAFEIEDSILCLSNAAYDAGFEKIEALIYFRNPESHILSTYKHRGKKGRLPDFTEWIENDYETMRLIQRFTEYRQSVSLKWTCRLYKADSSHLATSSFVDWLKLDKPVIPCNDKVNVSLTLSEILIIKKMRQVQPSCVQFLQDEFSTLSMNEKASDGELLMNYKSIIRNWLVPFIDLVDEVNHILPSGEKMEINTSSPKEKLNYTDVMNISEHQVTAFARAVEKSLKSKHFISKVRRLSQKVFKKMQRKFAGLHIQ